jgi:DNA-binding CsgD family transcriptional regulator
MATRDLLTPREKQVCARAAQGHSNKLIAHELGLSTSTVATFLGRAKRRLGVTSRTDLIRCWNNDSPSPHGWVSDNDNS